MAYGEETNEKALIKITWLINRRMGYTFGKQNGDGFSHL